MAAETAESDPVVATGQLLAILLVQELERIKHHFLALHRRIPCKRLVTGRYFASGFQESWYNSNSKHRLDV
jgi:hypothetical protein